MKHLDIKKPGSAERRADEIMEELLDSTPTVWKYEPVLCLPTEHSYQKLNRRTVFCTKCGSKR